MRFRFLLIYFPVLFFAGCKEQRQLAVKDSLPNSDNILFPMRKPEFPGQAGAGIRFQVALKQSTASGLYEFNAVLVSDRVDSTYFLTSTCEGELYSLRCKERQLALVPRVSCNASYPKLVVIPPQGSYSFVAAFQKPEKSDSLILGFDFHELARSDLQLVDSFSLGEIHNRPSSRQTIIWAKPVSLH